MRKNAGITAPIASSIFMGLGQIIVLKQYIKGLMFFILEVFVLINSNKIFQGIKGLITLGEPQPNLPVKDRDHSVFMMLDGLVIIFLVFIFILLYIYNIVDARKQGVRYEKTGESESIVHYLKNLADKAFAYLGLSPVFVLIMFFVFLPLLFSALIAFTNYSSPHHIPPQNTVDWVGLDTFKEMSKMGGRFSQSFARTAVWTFEWAFLCTITTYFGGLFMALSLNDKKIKLAKFFRTVFILPYAVPGLVMLFVWANLLNGQFGPITKLLRQVGIVDWLQTIGVLQKDAIPWLSDPTMAKIMLIIVNLWLGFPYFMMLITGVLTSIPGNLFEAAIIDGANKRQQFKYITLPLLLYQTLPLMILSFSYNMNNFGGVYFLTNGNPSDSLTTGTFAGSTDTLITWLYKLTLDQRLYNKASVVSIFVFLVIAPFAIYNFAQTKSFKEGEL